MSSFLLLLRLLLYHHRRRRRRHHHHHHHHHYHHHHHHHLYWATKVFGKEDMKLVLWVTPPAVTVGSVTALCQGQSTKFINPATNLIHFQNDVAKSLARVWYSLNLYTDTDYFQSWRFVRGLISASLGPVILLQIDATYYIEQ